MHVNDLHQRIWPTKEADSDSGREDLGETVKSQYSTNFGLFQFQRKVRRNSRRITIVQIVVWVIYVEIRS